MTRRVHPESDMHAYLDGELTGSERDEFEALLDTDPALRERLAGFEDGDNKLRAALDPILHDAVAPHLLETLFVKKSRVRTRVWLAAAAALAIFSLGAAAGGLWTGWRGQSDQVATNTAKQALDAHQVYVSEVRHPVEVGADQYDHLVGWLSKRLGQKLVAPDFTEEGYRLIGGRLLPGDGTAAAQFMYERASGERLTLYATHNPGARQTAFKLAASDGLRTFYWLDGPLGYAISGEMNEASLLDLARAAYRQITLPGSPGKDPDGS